MNVIMPLNKRVVVEPQAKEEVSKGGIIIPETINRPAPTRGRVIAISSDSDIKLKISPGDMVLFSKFTGTEIVIPAKTIEGKDAKIQIIKDEDILAVIRNEEIKEVI